MRIQLCECAVVIIISRSFTENFAESAARLGLHYYDSLSVKHMAKKEDENNTKSGA